MKIIIIGCGKVGLTLAELLSAEKHDVVLIDESSQKLSSIPEELDALRILGNGASVNIQQEAGVEEADLWSQIPEILSCLPLRFHRSADI